MQPISREISNGVLMISLPVPFKVEPVNVYFLKGETPTIIDTGVGTNRTWQWLEQELNKAEASLGDIRQILLTHGHIDHSGLAGQIHSQTGAPVLLHPLEWQEMQSIQYPSELDLKQQMDVYLAWGLSEEQVGIFDNIRREFNKLGTLPPKGVKFIGDGEVLKAGDNVLKAVFCPGHSPGLICYYLEEGRALFCGDHLLARISPNPGVTIKYGQKAESGLPLYMDSLNKLLGLPIDVCLTGHGEPIVNVNQRIGELQAETEKRQEQFRQYLAESGPTDVYRLTLTFLQSLGKNSQSDLFLGMREVFGQLSLLEQKKLVQAKLQQGVWVYDLA